MPSRSQNCMTASPTSTSRPGFTAAAPIVASDPTGAVTGQNYPNSLLRPDYRGIEPRLGSRVASEARLATGHSRRIRDLRQHVGVSSGCDTIGAATAVHQDAQHPEQRSQSARAGYRVQYGSVRYRQHVCCRSRFSSRLCAELEASVQEDLPGSMVLTATYLGIKGTRLMQDSLPNTFPSARRIRARRARLGFVYLSFERQFDVARLAQIQLRRRLSNGLTATLQYTYSKSIDDASAFAARAWHSRVGAECEHGNEPADG